MPNFFQSSKLRLHRNPNFSLWILEDKSCFLPIYRALYGRNVLNMDCITPCKAKTLTKICREINLVLEQDFRTTRFKNRPCPRNGKDSDAKSTISPSFYPLSEGCTFPISSKKPRVTGIVAIFTVYRK